MPSFLETLNYSSSNEDSRSELKALDIQPTDSILAITGGGARVLDLLIKKPQRIVALDFNPVQNYLLELKMVALRLLAYQEFLQFMGVSPSSGRKATYQQLRQALSSDATDFWDQHLPMIEEGVIYQGGWEKYFLKLAHTVGLFRHQLRAQLFACKSIHEQMVLWNERWDDGLWHFFLRLISSRLTWKTLFGDPAFYQHVPAEFSIYQYLRDRFSAAFNSFLISDSAFAHLLFFGKYDPRGALPIYLQEQYYKTIRNNLSSIQIVTGSLLDYLQTVKGKPFNKYSLSDYSSYTNYTDYLNIWQGVVKTAVAGAIVCERQFLVHRDIPEKLISAVNRDRDLENELSGQDDSIFYRFIIARIE